MKRSAPHCPAIDWSNVLGPVLIASADQSTGGIRPSELDDLQQMCLAYPRRAVRPRPLLDVRQLPFACEPVPWYPAGYFVQPASDAAVRPGAFLQYAAGDYYIQDAGSMLALALCQPHPGEWVCDTCAAPGGKSTGLSEALGGAGILLCNEVIRSRLAMLGLALARTGHTNHLVCNLEIEPLAEMCGPVFDCVLVDAPCTGQALVARGKQSPTAFGEQQIAHSSQRQSRILRAAAGLVKPQGRLIYSTCAFSFAENEQQIIDFLGEQPGWQLSPEPSLAAWRSPVVDGCYRVWPHRDGCGGAFAARLTKLSEAASCQASAPQASLERRGPLRAPQRSKSDWQQLTESSLSGLATQLPWLPDIEPQRCWRNRYGLHCFDPQLPTEWLSAAIQGSVIAECQPPRQGGRGIEQWSPGFDYGLWSKAQATWPTHVPICDLADAQAIQYVMGNTLIYPSAARDWCAMQWRDRRLGWGKLSNGSVKNHFPKLLRQSAIVGRPRG